MKRLLQIQVVGEAGLFHDDSIAFRRVLPQKLLERAVSLELAFDVDAEQRVDFRVECCLLELFGVHLAQSFEPVNIALAVLGQRRSRPPNQKVTKQFEVLVEKYRNYISSLDHIYDYFDQEQALSEIFAEMGYQSRHESLKASGIVDESGLYWSVIGSGDRIVVN